MKKLYLPLFLLVLAVVYYWMPKTIPPVPLNKINQSRSKNIFLGSRKIQVKTTDSVETDGCVSLQNSLNVLDFNLTVKEWITDISPSELEKCHDPQMAEKIAAVKASCLMAKIKDTDCLVNTMLLRSLLRTANGNSQEDQEGLADHIIAEFAKKEPDFKKLELYSRKMMDINPNEATVQKLWAMSKVLSQKDIRNLPEGLADEISHRIGDEAWKDKQMRDLDMIFKTGLEPSKVEDYARSLVQQSPKNSSSREMLGWSLWRQGQRGAAIDELETAMRLNPDDPWLKDVFAKVTSPTANDTSFPGRLQLGFNFNDLFR